MSTEARPMSGADNVDLNDVVGRVRELEEIVKKQDERIDALEAENEELREQVDSQATVEWRGSDGDLNNLFVGNHPVGVKIEKSRDELNGLFRLVFDEDASTVVPETEERIEEKGSLVDRVGANEDVSNASAGLSEDVRSKMLPIHEMWMDVANGREDRLGGNVNARRGARLFGNILRRADRSDDHENELWREVDVTEQNYILTSTGAKRILNEMEDPTSPPSQTVKRAMQQVEERSNRTVSFDDSEKVNRLVVRKDALHAVMETVQDTINGEESKDTADEPQEMDTSEDARQEVEERFGKMGAADTDD